MAGRLALTVGISPYLRRLRKRVGHDLLLLPTGQLADAPLSEFTIALLGDPAVAILGHGRAYRTGS